MKLTEALQKNSGFALNRSIETPIRVTGEWGYAAGEQGGSLVVYAIDERSRESTRRYPEDRPHREPGGCRLVSRPDHQHRAHREPRPQQLELTHRPCDPMHGATPSRHVAYRHELPRRRAACHTDLLQAGGVFAAHHGLG